MAQLVRRRRYGKVQASAVGVPDYLKFTAEEAGTFTLTIAAAVPTTTLQSVSYSADNGVTWVTTNNVNNTEVVITTPIISAGNSVLWKGLGTATASSNNDYSIFSSTGMFSASGNIMSLLFGDNFEGEVDLTGRDRAFIHLFHNCTTILTPPSLPATTLALLCYGNMFYGCSAMTECPELPATTLAMLCYYNMFYYCTTITTAPELPATTLAGSCYSGMFYGCTKLTQAPELPAMVMETSCYSYMFIYCVSLTTAPNLPATTLASSCYSNMFYGCTKLKNVQSNLPATTLYRSCYSSMFYNCNSLTTAPSLPATTLAVQCYSNMFQNTGLKSAPVLPATTLVTDCYKEMFRYCRSLNYVKALFITTPGASYTSNWLENTATSGTRRFVRSTSATWQNSITRGDSTVPSGWTIATS